MADASTTDESEPDDRPTGRPGAEDDKDAARPVSDLEANEQFEALKGWWKADADHSREWRVEAREAFAFRAGEQWTPEDKALLDSRNRPHIVFNRVLAILKAVAGMEINGRHEISFIPRGTQDTAVNELLTAASKWMADECDGEDEESQAFDDTCTCGMGWCLSDDALVRLPNTHFATTRLYSGSIVQIGLENGKELTGTPNHPVLTDMGWKRLCDLHEGDNLINSAFLERINGLPIEQFDHVETRLKDKIDAFRAGRESLRCSTAPDDFYSDGAGSKVHIVYADSFLLDKVRNAIALRKVDELLLSGRDLLAKMRAFFFSKTHGLGAIYSAICQSTFNWVHMPLAQPFSDFAIAQNMPSSAEPSSRSFGMNPITLSNLDGRQTFSEVEPNEFFDRHRGRRPASPRSHSMTGSPEAQTDRGNRYSNLIADFFDWKPLLEIEARKLGGADVLSIFVTQVKSRVVRPVEGFAVHDVGTSLGFFVAGDIITSNTESRMSYEDEHQGLYVEEQIDPKEMYWDRTARKKNLTDARRKHRVRRMPFSDAAQLFPGKTRAQLDAVWADESLGDYPTRTLEERRKRDSDNSGIHPYDDTTEVTIVNTQWIEKEPFWLVADVQKNEKVALSQAEFDQFKKRMDTLRKTVPPEMAEQFEVHAVRMVKKVYKSAFLGAGLLRKAEDAPIEGQFSWACITGERDNAKGTWFGLVRVMRDPQMWANKWLSQILHILNSTAKGGILAEEDAFEDQREAENSYAQSDQITYVTKGALSGQKPKIIPKPGAGAVEGYLGLMAFAISSVKDVVGINLELLGQRDENQPGIVEAMRKQAGMTVLATLFDSLRRFRKIVGRKRLYFIQNFLSDGRLIRVVGTDSNVQALPLVRDKTLGEYNVVVDDTPTSPNQKEANWAIIQPLLVVFKDQLIANPQVFGMLLEYSPLPNRIVEAIKGFIAQQQQDPDAQIDKKLQRDLIESNVSKNQSTAEMQNAKAGASQATAMYDFAMAKHLLESGDTNGLKGHLDMMEAAAKMRTADAKAQQASAEADHTKAKTAREMVGTHLDVAAAHEQGQQGQADRRSQVLGGLIDHLTATSGAHRDVAVAHKDHVAAIKDARTPIALPAPAGGQ